MEHLKGIFSRSAKSQTGPEDGDAGEEEGRSPSPVTDDDKLMKLVSIQSFDGAFRVDSILPELLGTTLEDMTEGNAELGLLLRLIIWLNVLVL